jgi:hypothetical protein
MKVPTDEKTEQKDRQEKAEVLSVAMEEMRMAHKRSLGDYVEERSEDGYTESMCVLEWVRTIAELKKANY